MSLFLEGDRPDPDLLGGGGVVDRSSPTEAEASPARCFGRSRELALLEQLHAETVASRRGRVAFVSGGPGMGKSRLVDELARRLASQGVLVLEGRSRESTRSYQPLLELIEAALVAVGTPPLRQRAAEIAALLGGANLPSTADSAATSEIRRVALFERVAGFLTDVARQQPLVLVVHDLHLADGGSRALLTHLAATRFAAPELHGAGDDVLAGLLVVTSRDRDPPWADGVSAERIELGGLDNEGIREFFQAPEVLAFFSQATGGRPRALEALLEARPADADELFRGRIARLTAPALAVVRALAVYARPAHPETLRAIAHTNELDFGRAVSELVAAKLLVRLPSDGVGRLGFARSADEEAIYHALDDGLRAELHHRVGRHLWTQGGETELVSAAEHLVRGRAGDLAVDAALAAGSRLEAAFGYDRAIALYRGAHALTTLDNVRAGIEARLVDLGRLTGDYATALDDAERLRRRAPDDPATLRRIGQLHVLRDDFVRARAALDRARQLAADRPDERAPVLAASAELNFLDGRHADAKADCEAGLAAAASVGPSQRHLGLEIRNTLGKVLLAEGRYADAARLFGDNLDDARALGAAHEETRALINQGIARLRLGDDAHAAQAYQAALKVADASEDHRHRAFCLQNLGVLAHWRSDFSTALRYFQEAVGAFKKIGHRARLAWLALDLASLHLDLGAVDQAVAMAALADRLSDGKSPAAVAINREVIGGRIALRQGEHHSARARFEAARSLAARAENRERHAEATLHLVRVELDAGQLAAVEKLLGEISSSASQATRARAQLLAGEAALGRGQLEQARRCLLGAVETFHQLGDLDGEWRAQFTLGRVAGAIGDLREAQRRYRLARELDETLCARVPDDYRGTVAEDPARQALSRLVSPRPLAPPQIAVAPAAPRTVATTWMDQFPRVVGRHPRLEQVYSLVDKVAPHDSLVLIRGESGTGKELVADAIHSRSSRAGRPFVKVNCGALVETLLLSELFGHERGAFTGAIKRKIGHFESADTGTIFLDEIGDISPQTQVALLRVLQEREFERVGSVVPIKVDVRILCATNRDLEAMVASGQFREDLYYRLKGIQIELPPLRQRIEDIPLLADSFLVRVAEERGVPRKRLAPDAVELLLRHAWPGNVRELENVIRSVSLFADGQVIGVRDFADYTEIFRDAPRAPATLVPLPSVTAPPALASTPAPTTAPSAWERLSQEGLGLRELQEKIEIECITRALSEAQGNITKAAGLLKMKRPRLSQLIKEYGISL